MTTTMVLSPDFQLSRQQYRDPETITIGEYVSRVETTVKESSSQPNFSSRRKLKLHVSPLPYHIKKTVIVGPSGSFTETAEGYDTSVWPPRGPFFFIKSQRIGRGLPWVGNDFPEIRDVSPDLVNRAERQARTKLLAGLKDQKVNLMQAYAESKQTHEMIAKTAEALAKVIVALRRGDLVSAGAAVGLSIGKRAAARYRRRHTAISHPEDIDKMLSNGILQVQYGIRPLIADVIGLAELTAQKVEREIVNTMRASSTMHDTVVANAIPVTGIVTSGTGQHRVTVSYGLTFVGGDNLLHAVSQIGLSNPLLIAWELMPWSFVIDWFLPLGNAISNLDATFGLTFEKGWWSVRTSSDWSASQHIETLTSSGSAVQSGQSNEFRRTVLSNFPLPSLPAFKNPASVEHLLNAFALLASARKGISVRW